MAHKWARWLHNPCRLGGPHLFRRGAESEVAHKWARWLHNPCRLGGVPTASERGAESEVAHKWARWLHNPCRLGGPHNFGAGAESHVAPSGQGGYITPAAWGVPTSSQHHFIEQGPESEVAHKWARSLHNPCRLGGPHLFTAPLHRAGGENQKWPTSGQGRYITSVAWGIPTSSGPGAESHVAPSGQGGYITPAAWGGPHRFRAGGIIRSGPQVGKVAT